MMRHWLISIVVTAAATLAGLTAGCDGVTNAPKTQTPEPLLSNEGKATMGVSDALLASALATALKSDPETREADIQVAVTQGRARLSGFVANAATKLRAGDLVQQTPCISAVDNRLILRYHAGLVPDPLGDARVRL
jgi:osmotically-inducible protein OsmY